MPGERDRLLADAFHQAAVAGYTIGEVVDDCVTEPRIDEAFGQRHADGIGETLTQRPRRRLDAGCVAVLGVARRLGAELAEVGELVHRHARIAGQMQQRIEQHRAVPGGEDEAIAVRPIGGRGVELQEAGEENGGDISHAHGHAGMAGLGLLHRVHGERPNGIRHVLVRHGAVFARLHCRISHGSPPRCAAAKPVAAVAGAALAGRGAGVHL